MGSPAGSGDLGPCGVGCAAPGNTPNPEPGLEGAQVEGGMGCGAHSAQPGGDAALGPEPTERRMTQNPSPTRSPTNFPSWQAPSPRFWVTQRDSQSLPIPHQLFVYEVPFVPAIKAASTHKPRRSPDNLIKDSLLQSTCR